jgi:16S rRNA (guanine966-N2)-methyltransferase
MESRRPPRSNSSGRKPNFDRGRAARPFHAGKPASDGAGTGVRRADKTRDERYQDRSGRDGDSPRRDGRFGSRPKGRGDGLGKTRFNQRTGNNQNRSSRAAKDGPVENLIRITSDAQITDGKLRGRTLQNSNSPNTVPTKRKLREIAFKVISRRVRAARILDLGAGAGTIGIEAISRGAMLATFVERSARMCTFLRRNLSEMGVKAGHGEVLEMEILPFLKKASRRRRLWEIVYLDLPDGSEHAAILDHLSHGHSITTGGLLLVEHTSDTSHPDQISRLKRWRTIDQGETILSIYERI